MVYTSRLTSCGINLELASYRKLERQIYCNRALIGCSPQKTQRHSPINKVSKVTDIAKTRLPIWRKRHG